jgi:hypothetical protein
MDGSVHMMKLTGLLWSAIGKNLDFMSDESATSESDEAEAE